MSVFMSPNQHSRGHALHCSEDTAQYRLPALRLVYSARRLATRRLELFTGDVGDAASWKRLEATHGASFSHIVAGAAITPTPPEEAALGLEVARVNFLGVLLLLAPVPLAQGLPPSLRRALRA